MSRLTNLTKSLFNLNRVCGIPKISGTDLNVERIDEGPYQIEDRVCGVSKISGIDINVERIDESPYQIEEGQEDPSVGFHYKVTITPDGTNPDYPDTDKKLVHYFTVAARSDGFAMNGSLSCIAQGSKWVKFVLKEEISDPVGNKAMGAYKPVPPHRIAQLQAIAKGTDGKRHCAISMSAHINQSDYNSPAYQNALKSPIIHYI